MIQNYASFCAALLRAGFSLAGGSGGVGLPSLLMPDICDPSIVKWHTGDPETDPWEWRVRVLEERDNIAYAKVFFRKAGYITREWAPFFLAVRQKGQSFEEAYEAGLYSPQARRIVSALAENGALPTHELKRLAGFGKEGTARFERALIDLQMGLFVTMCGRAQKQSKTGGEYGWHSAVFCLTEEFWPPEVFGQAADLAVEEAYEAIVGQALFLNPRANCQKLKKFIFGT